MALLRVSTREGGGNKAESKAAPLFSSFEKVSVSMEKHTADLVALSLLLFHSPHVY